ncbi:MAG: four helix bundle protein [Planctomycetaceae bacterium]|nr:four helix bundle protein [Planctomycetaceae bacterium]
MKKVIRKHTDLEAYQVAFREAMAIFERSRSFPMEERYSLTDQIRRSSRSVCANLAEAWRKRRYTAAFVSKLSESEAEAAETQVWLQFAVECGYLDPEVARSLYLEYDRIIAMIVGIIRKPDAWGLASSNTEQANGPKRRNDKA